MTDTAPLPPYALTLLCELQIWYTASDGGKKILDLGWGRKEREYAEELLRLGYLHWVRPIWRKRGFYILTDLGKRAIE